jgi:PPM family protein phosphatase
MKLNSSSCTDTGRVRDINEDSFVCNDQLKLFLVADGLGGHAGGEVASQMTAELFTNAIQSATRSFDPASYLVRITKEINSAVYDRAESDPTLKGMGTTLTALYFSYDTVYIVHVGDSRAYFLQDGMIWQLSQDHSLEAEDPGSVGKDMKHIITRSIGHAYLLCSDGLHGLVEDEEMGKIVSKGNVSDAAQKLIDLANQRGGEDNITTVITQIERL